MIGRPRKAIKRTEIRRKGWMKHGTKRIPSVNVKRQAKRKATYTAFIRSPEWKALRKAALKRADFRCEELVPNPAGERRGEPSVFRCTATKRLTVHHRTYARFGGRELPTDLQVLCKAHHEYLHALEGKHAPTRRSA